jgi:hypothetical protein
MDDLVRLMLDQPEFLTRGLVEERIDAILREFPADAPETTGPLFDAPRRRLYLIDEPEQRLHPALQRRAAAWLTGRMEDWGAQCVIATHALAFMDVGEDSRVHEVIRAGPLAVIERVDMASFDAQTLLAREMGFDRGELFARWNAFLFVEGLGDLAVLEELFARAPAVGRHPSERRARSSPSRRTSGDADPPRRDKRPNRRAPGRRKREGNPKYPRGDSAHRKDMLTKPDGRGTVARIVEAEGRPTARLRFSPLSRPTSSISSTRTRSAAYAVSHFQGTRSRSVSSSGRAVATRRLARSSTGRTTALRTGRRLYARSRERCGTRGHAYRFLTTWLTASSV